MLFEKLKNIEKKDEKEARALIKKSAVESIIEEIKTVICRTESLQFLRLILSAFGKDEIEQKKKTKITQSVLESLQTAKINTGQLQGIIDTIISDLQNCSTEQLLKLVDFCMTSMRKEDDESRSWKYLLPPLLELLQEKKILYYRGNEVSGSAFKSEILKSTFTTDWDKKIIIPLSQMFREISMEKEEHSNMIKMLCSKMLEVEVEEIPPLIHQLLKLTAEQNFKHLLLALRQYFKKHYALAEENETSESYDEIETAPITLKQVQEIEGIVFFYIYEATNMQQSIFKEFLKFLRNNVSAPEFILDPFTTSVLLTITDFHRDQVFEILKAAVVRQIQEEENKKTSFWLKKIVDQECDILGVMEKVIENSKDNTLLVLHGMMSFAFVLLSVERKSKEEKSITQIGLKILIKIIEKKNAAILDVLKKLVEYIIDDGTCVSMYTECLGYICREKRSIILEYQNWIAQLIEELPLLQASTAFQVIRAIAHLPRHSPLICDCLVIVLRKCLYHKGTEIREMAAMGFLEVAKYMRGTSLTLSQMTLSGSSLSSGQSMTQIEHHLPRNQGPPNSSNQTFGKEILAILKRGFSQELSVRLQLYRGLSDVVQGNPEIAEPITETLVDQFMQFYVLDEEIMPPIQFEKCTAPHGTEIITHEPIGDLIFVLQRIYVKIANRDANVVQKLGVILESLCDRMCKLELEHLQIDNTADFYDDLPKALRKVEILKLCSTVLEALISYRIESWTAESVDYASNINSLLKAYNRIIEFSKKVHKPKKDKKEAKNKKDQNKTVNDTTTPGKKGRSGTVIKMPGTIIDMKIIAKIMPLLYQESVPWATKEQSSNLKKRVEFHNFILQAAIQILQTLKNSKESDLEDFRKKYLKDCFKVAEVIYNKLILNFNQIYAFDRNCGSNALECFKEMSEMICNHFPNDLAIFLKSMMNTPPPSGASQQTKVNCLTQKALTSIFDVVKDVINLEADDDITTKKLSLPLVETISHFVYKLSFEREENVEVVKWLKNMTNEIEGSSGNSIIQTIIKLLFHSEECTSEKGEIVTLFCIALCHESGQIDEVEIEETPDLKIVRLETIHTVYNLINNAVKHKLNIVVWYLGRLKAELAAYLPALVGENVLEKIREKDRLLCNQLNEILKIMEIFTNVNLEIPGSSIDATFKNLHLMYNTLCHLIKYFHGKSTAINAAFQSVGFIPVIQRAGKSLKNNFYNLVTSTEEKQTSSGSRDSNVLRNKVLKETKNIPRVVFEIEQFQKELLLLEKKTKVDLERYTKHSLNRDFRIKREDLLEFLHNQDTSMYSSQNSTRENAEDEDQGTTVDSGEEMEDLNEDETNAETDEESSSTSESNPRKKRKIGKE